MMFRYSDKDPIQMTDITKKNILILPLKIIKRAIGMRITADKILKNRLDFTKSTLPFHVILNCQFKFLDSKIRP